MDAKELIKKVRKIEIKTKGLSSQIFSGEYHSAFKGRGMAFSEVREYQPGDDIRAIDWNVTARFNHPYIKIFEEEREMTVMLIVDVSGSESFGTKEYTKREKITEICAVLAFSAIQNNDKIGVLMFSDKVEKFIPPKKGRKHILRIIREMLEFEPESKGTDISEGLSYFQRAVRKRSIAFVISDFMDDGFKNSLRIARRRHDMVGIQVYDKREQELPNVGLTRLLDPETDQMRWVNTGNKKVRLEFAARNRKRQAKLKDTMLKSGVDFASIATDESYVVPLMNLFKRRER